MKNRFIYLLIAALVLGCWGNALAATSQDSAQIQTLMKGIWERPGSTLDISPITIQGTHAVVGWVQGTHGGRALLRKVSGKWAVVLCSGSALLDQSFLQEAGMLATDARILADSARVAERSVPSARINQFDSFRGIVRMK